MELCAPSLIVRYYLHKEIDIDMRDALVCVSKSLQDIFVAESGNFTAVQSAWLFVLDNLHYWVFQVKSDAYFDFNEMRLVWFGFDFENGQFIMIVVLLYIKICSYFATGAFA